MSKSKSSQSSKSSKSSKSKKPKAARGWAEPADLALRPQPLAGLECASTPGWTGDRAAAEAQLAANGAALSELQEKLFADGRSGGTRSVLLVLQGMDTSGKGGIVRHVIGQVDPQGVMHRSFGVPTDAERKHNYLWRIRNALPRPGYIGVFDRSHYEDVLVARVNELVPPEVWGKRYEEINAFEAKVAAAGTRIVKVALVVSAQEQKARLRERLTRKDKFWKYNPSDIDERAKWPAYREAYQAVLDRTSTDTAPWHVVPADRKWFARLAVSQLLLDALTDLDLGWPPPSFDVKAEKARLEKA
ncbi:polyphosphate:nucleotide phosphotransferase, PPK2 family [Sanguibacter gelidistatuariae]|uniref:Polyphosphate:nucleotide phosphotransferase, PPK2 family n=1 Tax=Sanguibacter gelidistatuariae TaxID=1814289 RepID=A0A1G6RPD7_9MICO|nr:PPK2 family polyphosphate kinase [Sanguibacter gelidistatuariae]SDD05796.1 polyphosphate:nucleotide phosphotransferase, PPK2 family [Sanguibacter gelidistatuariae]